MYPERLRMSINTHSFGQYHILDLEMHWNFTLEKEVDSKGRAQLEGWNSIAREQFK